MRKRNELTDPSSCMSRADDDEMTFVLLGRDVVAPTVIRMWCEIRVLLGKNKHDDEQIIEAMKCARTMEMDRRHKERSKVAERLTSPDTREE